MQTGFIPNNTSLFSEKITFGNSKTEINLSPASYKIIRNKIDTKILIVPEMSVLIESDIIHGVLGEYHSMVLGAAVIGFEIQTGGTPLPVPIDTTIEILDYSAEIDISNVVPAGDNNDCLFIDIKYYTGTSNPDISTPGIDTGSPDIDTPTPDIDIPTPDKDISTYAIKSAFVLLEEVE